MMILLRMAVMLLPVLGVGSGLYAWQSHRKSAATAAMGTTPPPTRVAVAEAQLLAAPRRRAGVGTLEAVRRVTLAAEVNGRVTRIFFEPGQAVKAGDPVLQLNDAPERAELERLKAQAHAAELAYNRTRQLAPHAVPQAQLDDREAALRSVRADIARIEAVIAQKLVRAPFDGVLGVRRVDLGAYIEAGRVIATLTDLSVLYITFTLPEQAWSELKPGLVARFTVDSSPGRVFTGRVQTVEPQIGATNRAITVQAVADNPDLALAPGMFANVQLELPPGPQAIVVPETAIDFASYGATAFVVRAKAAGAGQAPVLVVKRVLVQAGERFEGKVVVLSGLAPGDRVVTSGQVKLHDDVAVEPVARDTLAVPQTH
ncbi:efflux RND transporter periplasmic adaptor subunit [Vineibacter terrae]|uniref:efflux RND transporter periplasmic adaptor subunit n=1 Tax=Vineibacter terrae TaxID=2586908 RepID=UPI002E304D3B|nr:efflux RND transporter periplasmic adaptor subunit [Vineibacter terrae]HEX2890027.1 efflux RND transporter periplasmic adaptor subunit [Vineibacter terrae]